MFFLHLETKMACRWVVLLVTGVVEMWICSTEVKSDSSPKMAVPLSINKFPHILRCHNNLRICESSWNHGHLATTKIKKIKRLVDGKAPTELPRWCCHHEGLDRRCPPCDLAFFQKMSSGLARIAGPMQDTAKKRCRFGSEWSMCKFKIWAFLHCILWSFTNFLLHLLLLPYFSCCLCNISLNVHMSAHWQICKYGSGTGTQSCSHVGPIFRMTNQLGLWSTLANSNLLSSAFLERQELTGLTFLCTQMQKGWQWQHVVNSLWIGSCALQLYASLWDILAKSLYKCQSERTCETAKKRWESFTPLDPGHLNLQDHPLPCSNRCNPMNQLLSTLDSHKNAIDSQITSLHKIQRLMLTSKTTTEYNLGPMFRKKNHQIPGTEGGKWCRKLTTNPCFLWTRTPHHLVPA